MPPRPPLGFHNNIKLIDCTPDLVYEVLVAKLDIIVKAREKKAEGVRKISEAKTRSRFMAEIAELKSKISTMKEELDGCKEENRALRESETSAMDVEHQPDILEGYRNEILRLRESNDHLSEQLKFEHQWRARSFGDFDREHPRLQGLRKLRLRMRSRERRAMRRSSTIGKGEWDFKAMMKECQKQTDENRNLKKYLRKSKEKFDDIGGKNKQQAKTIDNCKDENKELQKSMKQVKSKLKWKIEDLENQIKDMRNRPKTRLDGPEGGVKDSGDLEKEIATLRSSNEELTRNLDLKDSEYRSLITQLEEGVPGPTTSTETATADDKESHDPTARAKRKRIEK